MHVRRASSLLALSFPLLAGGPGAERFGGTKDNVQIGRILMERVRR
jgi:alkaline phosphatase